MSCNKEKNSAAASDNYGRAVKYLGIFGGAQGVSVLLGMVRNKFASIFLGAAGIGVISLYNRTIQLFSDLTSLSLSLSAVRRMSDAYDNEDASSVVDCVKVVRSIALLTGIVGMLLLALFAPLVACRMSSAGDYSVLHLVLLSPVVLFMAVSGGELAILRGVKQPAKIALYTLWTAVSAVLVTVPLYYVVGAAGIAPAIFVVALLQMGGALFFSTPLYPYKASPFSWKLLRQGLDIVKLGAGYIYATILVSGSMWLIYQVINAFDGDEAVGFFAAGYMFVGMLPSILFAAFDSDYYPRLAGIFANLDKRNAMVNGHIEVHLFLQVPVILCVVFLLPWLLPLFYREEFLVALPMAQVAVMALLFHIMTYPISFLPVSKGDTLIFALQETAYNLSFVGLTLLGYNHWGWLGAGVGMALARILDLLVVCSIARLKYSFHLSARAVGFFVMSLLLGGVVLFSALYAGRCAWAVPAGFAAIVCSVSVSLYQLSRHSNILSMVTKRIFKK